METVILYRGTKRGYIRGFIIGIMLGPTRGIRGMRAVATYR